MINPVFGIQILKEKRRRKKKKYLRPNLKTAFGINFGPWEVPKVENLHFHIHALLNVQNQF